jgi:hypothetical protein
MRKLDHGVPTEPLSDEDATAVGAIPAPALRIA